MTDTMGRMHSDAQFAGSSSVPAHVEMMGFLGMGNNPMVGAAENGGYPPTQNGDIRSLFWLFSLMALQN